MVAYLRLAILLSLCSCVSLVLAATPFSARLATQQVEYGHPAQLLLSAPLSTDLRRIHLAKLKQDFHLVPDAEIHREARQQQWRIRLYPRRQGELLIPALTLDKHAAGPWQVRVTAPRDPNSDQLLQTSFDTSLSTAWLHQQVLIRLSLLSQDRYVVLENRALNPAGGQLQALPLVSHKVKNSNLYRHQIGWAYFPARSGKQVLDLPAIIYKRDGVITHRFYLPRQTLQVRALPLYVPDNLSVGRLALQVEATPRIMLSNRLQELQLRLHSDGLQAPQQPVLDAYLQGPPDLSLYPATTRITHDIDITGLHSQSLLHLPVKASGTGLYQLNDIRLPYFDPDSGKLQSLHYQWPGILFISPWLLGLIGVTGLLLLGYLFSHTLRRSRHYLRQRKARQQAKQQLLAATTATELRAALLQLVSIEQGTANTTLSDWHVAQEISAEPLHQALYRRATYDIDSLKQPYLMLFGLRLQGAT